MSHPAVYNHVRSFLAGLTDSVWPRSCFCCDDRIPPESPAGCLCTPCRGVLAGDTAATCPRCSSGVGPHVDVSAGCHRCRTDTYRFVGTVRLGAYDGTLRDAILRIKHESGEPLAEELGRLLAETRERQLAAHRSDVVVPVPLHWRRRWGRGYNQSEPIARGLAERLRLPYRSYGLRRVRATPSQRDQTPTMRWENVRGAFRAGPFSRVRDKRVLLVDDVLTTGATADAAAHALLQAGAAQVAVAVLAHR